MDPLTLLVTAVVTGGALGLHQTASQAVQDAYAAFRHLILEKYRENEDLNMAMKQMEAKPESEGRKMTLREELAEAEVHEDEELVLVAQEFLRRADPIGAEGGRYTVEVTASDHSIAVGGDVHGDVSGEDRRHIEVKGDSNVVGDHGETHVHNG